MSIENKHAYRFGFLLSDEWALVRIEALARDGAKCRMCGEESISNDAHHIIYRIRWKDTKAEDLITLCRDCHQIIHLLTKPKKETKLEDIEDTIESAKKEFELAKQAVIRANEMMSKLKIRHDQKTEKGRKVTEARREKRQKMLIEKGQKRLSATECSWCLSPETFCTILVGAYLPNPRPLLDWRTVVCRQCFEQFPVSFQTAKQVRIAWLSGFRRKACAVTLKKSVDTIPIMSQ